MYALFWATLLPAPNFVVTERHWFGTHGLIDHLLVGTEPAVNRLSPLGDCRLDAAAGMVALERQQTASSPRPQLEQRVLEEWQCSRLTRDVVQDRVHQARLESESHSPRRPLDRLAQAWGIEAAQQMLMRGHTRGQVWIHGAARIEVRAHRHDNLGRSIRDGGRVEQIGYELGPLLLVSALRNSRIPTPSARGHRDDVLG